MQCNDACECIKNISAAKCLQYSMCVCNGYKYHTEAWNSHRSISLITGTGSNTYVQMARHGMSTNVSVVVNDYDGSCLCTCNVVCLFCGLFVCVHRLLFPQTTWTSTLCTTYSRQASL